MKAALTLLAPLALTVALTACGHNMEQKAATGAAAGLVVGGPIGAAVGAGVGAGAQKVEDADKSN